MALAFEQQPKESAKAFAAFSVYLGMGPERSLEAVARKVTKSSRLLKRWSRRFDWPGRVRGHAERMAAVEREATEALAREKGAEWLKRQQALRETEWEMHEKCIAAAKRGLAAFEAREKVYANLADIARMLEVASKLGRLASGMATDKTEVTGEDGGPIRLELNAALNKVYGEVVDVEATAVPAALPEGEGNGLPGQRARGNPVAGECQAVSPAESGEKATP
ncbi:MAG: hypothetical protein ACYDH9_19490 [Limisphaerales bacterium]